MAERQIHNIKSGETLSEIAARYGVSVGQLAEANDIKDPNRIEAGKSIRIPSKKGDGVSNFIASIMDCFAHLFRNCPGKVFFFFFQ